MKAVLENYRVDEWRRGRRLVPLADREPSVNRDPAERLIQAESVDKILRRVRGFASALACIN